MVNKTSVQARICFILQLQTDKGKRINATVTQKSSSPHSGKEPDAKPCPGQSESDGDTNDFSGQGEGIGAAEVHSYTLQANVKDFERPLSGFLVATFSQADKPVGSVFKLVRLVPPIKSTRALWPFAVVFGAAFVCILVALFAVRKFGLTSRMGTATWDFSQSWATNITIAGAVLASLLAFAGLPEYGEILSKNSYLSLSVLFGALVMLAPSVYNFIRKPIEIAIPDRDNPANTTGLRFQGYVFGFLLAALVIVWGVLSQLLVVGFLLQELVTLGPLPESMGLAFQIVIAFVAVFLLIYCDITIYFTVKRQIAHRDAHRNAQLKIAAAADAVAQQAAHHLNPPLPSWSLL